MHPERLCPDPQCHNRGLLALDANVLLFLIEGTILYVEQQYPELETNASRLDTISEELTTNLNIISSCCGLDGRLHISERVLQEEVISVDPRAANLFTLRKFNARMRRTIMRGIRSHFPDPSIVPDYEVDELRGLFPNPSNRPNDIDASLLVAAIHLAANGHQTIILTSDPDFSAAIRVLMPNDSITLGGEDFSIKRLINRDYIQFIRRLHDCCRLETDRYAPLARTFHTALVSRLQTIKKANVSKRIVETITIVWDIHNESIRLKLARR